MNALNPSHAALIAEVTALRASLGDAVELCESLRADRDALRAALECIVAALSQPVQTCEPSQRTAEVLLGDCTFARQTARAALERSAP